MKQALNLNLNNDDVYYGNEASWLYMSTSQYKDFRKCEAQALAKLKGDWDPISEPKALLVGNFVHSYFESPEAHEKFKEVNSDQMLSKRKPHGLLKDFQVAEKMIQQVEQDALFNYLWQGEKELAVTGELYGVEWKGKIDLLNVEKGYFVDLKTTARLDTKIWNSELRKYESFVEGYGYVLQLAIYEHLLEQVYGKPFAGYIYAVTKEDIPNIAAIEVPEMYKEEALREMGYYIDRVQAVKMGEEAPERCGNCDYCKKDKQLDRVIDVRELLD